MTEFDRDDSPSLPQEFLAFMRAYRLWWLAPIALVAVALAGLVILGGTGAAPFIYTLF